MPVDSDAAEEYEAAPAGAAAPLVSVSYSRALATWALWASQRA